MPSITDTAVPLGHGSTLIQNVGPDPVYLGPEGVTAADGFPVPSGASIAVAYSSVQIYGISGGTSDVRLLGGGTGIYVAAPAS